MSRKAAEGPEQFFGGADGLLAQALAAAVMQKGPLALASDNRIWHYTRGVWAPRPDAVRERVAALLGDRFRNTYVAAAFAHVDRWLKDRGVITCDPVEQFVNFRNGLYDWRAGQLCQHSPEIATTVQLPVAYDAAAVCPTFDVFLAQVLPPDMIELVWRLIGYLMMSGNPAHAAVMLTGSGRNGKGTLLRVITALLGRGNVTAVSLANLTDGHRFATAGLFGKLANIAGDIDGGHITNTATFKALTGQDMITAEHKGLKSFDFTPWAVPVFSANRVPSSADVTVGYLSRWRVVDFPNSFEGREDSDLTGKLTAELPGIATRALWALGQLAAEGWKFPATASSLAARQKFERSVDQIKVWADDDQAGVLIGPEYTELVPRTPLYGRYKVWAADNGHRCVRSTEFYDRVESLATCVWETKSEGTRGFRGLMPRTPLIGAYQT